jgi:hypothetical protein
MIHTMSNGAGPGSLVAMLAGERNIPEPIVVPMTTATALHKPSRRGSVEGGSFFGDSRMRQNGRVRVDWREDEREVSTSSTRALHPSPFVQL